MSPIYHTPKISLDELRNNVKKEYANVALDPQRGYHFHTGREALKRIGYDEALYETSLSYYNNKNYDQALKGFKSFLEKFPPPAQTKLISLKL